MNPVFDSIVIGGGLAGGIAALHLARAGQKVAIFEKEKLAHHKVCGEFLSPEGHSYLKDIGVDLFSMGAAPIDGFHLHGPKRTSQISLPNAAAGFCRKRLDEHLLHLAESSGAKLMMGSVVTALKDVDGLYEIKTSTGIFRSKQVVVATGKKEFKAVPKRLGKDTGLVGFKMHLRLRAEALERLSRHCDLFVFKYGYAGLCEIDGDLANFCLLIRRDALKTVGTSWAEISSFIAKHNSAAKWYLKDSVAAFEKPVSVANVPYGFVLKNSVGRGVFCVGDQAAVIPSLTGDGMSIALMTGTRAAQAILAGQSAEEFQLEMFDLLSPQIASGFYVHRLFRLPAVVDFATTVVRFAPFLFRKIFESTRLQLDQKN